MTETPRTHSVRKTKIVATIGPATRSRDGLRSLMLAGINVARINCSHATPGSIRSDVARIRQVATELDLRIAIMLDLQGPKIRVGMCEPPVELAPGDTLTVVMDEDLKAVGARVGTTWTTLADDVKAGEPALFADGALSGTVKEVRPARGDAPAEVDIVMVHGGKLGSRKGINLPETDIKAPALTAKDRVDLGEGVAAGVDYVALSFVRTASDVAELREALTSHGADKLPVVAKIEKPQACEEIESILGHVQGIMVARGDLGVEIPFERVPVVQKDLIEAANRRGVLVITATQMLDSMERNPRPTRAEATDVANAILDGTDAVMLSGETAAGDWPVEAVQTMDAIARQVENSTWMRPPDVHDLPTTSTAEATVLQAACFAVRQVPRPLVVFTSSGSTAIKACKSRPPLGIYAITHKQQVADRLSLAWGVTSVVIPVIDGMDNLIAAGERALMGASLLQNGQEVVLLAGQQPQRGSTNMMKVEIIDGRSNL
jgi:pyruvate kinase